MKKNLIIALLIVLICGLQNVSAQFPIKLPKLPKIEKPKEKPPQSDSEQSNPQNPAENPSVQPSNKQSNAAVSQAVTRPLPTSVPVFMKDTLGIDAKTENLNNFSKWVPQVSFDLFYDNSAKLRYVAEWFKPDGSLWFSEPLEMYNADDYAKKVTIRSPDSDEVFKASAINTVGTFGVKISNSKTNEIVFQGKFKVGKLAHADEPKEKNLFRFYVDHDWLIPVGYAGYDIESWRNGENYPAVMMWLKGSLDNKEFEAVLFHDGQKIATTDKGGFISTIQERGGMCYQIREVCEFHLWRFSWNNFLLNDKGYLKEKYPNTLFTGDLTGEFTVKIFYKGEQIREAKFSLAADGSPVRNSFSDQIYSTISLIPVKASGTAEKWNANAWKTDLFYGNPLSGFAVQ
ncbi:MAG TPA: hypothetical protein VNB22_23800 [Pyrinomonadaceae bacterium]|nr:hypothetical protein [Pyrinomonadaceae bacterium]